MTGYEYLEARRPSAYSIFIDGIDHFIYMDTGRHILLAPGYDMESVFDLCDRDVVDVIDTGVVKIKLARYDK